MCSAGVPLGQFQGILDLFLSQFSGITMVHHHIQTIIMAKLAALNIICFFNMSLKYLRQLAFLIVEVVCIVCPDPLLVGQ